LVPKAIGILTPPMLEIHFVIKSDPVLEKVNSSIPVGAAAACALTEAQIAAPPDSVAVVHVGEEQPQRRLGGNVGGACGQAPEADAFGAASRLASTGSSRNTR